NRVQVADIGTEALFPEIRRGIHQDLGIPLFHQDGHPAAAVLGIIGVAAAPHVANARHSAGSAAAQDGDAHGPYSCCAGNRALANSRKKLAVVCSARRDTGTPRTSATVLATWATNAGSLVLPRCGTG